MKLKTPLAMGGYYILQKQNLLQNFNIIAIVWMNSLNFERYTTGINAYKPISRSLGWY